MFLKEKEIEAIVGRYAPDYVACIHPIFDETTGQYVDLVKSGLPPDFPIDKLKPRATSTMIDIEHDLGVNPRTGEVRKEMRTYDVQLWPPLADGGTRTDYCGKASNDFNPKDVLTACVRSTQYGSSFRLAEPPTVEVQAAIPAAAPMKVGNLEVPDHAAKIAAEREALIAEELGHAKRTVPSPSATKPPVAAPKKKPQPKRQAPKITAPPPVPEEEEVMA